MPWLKLDDQMGTHRKTRRLLRTGGAAAWGLHILALLHCSRYLTDGYVEAEFVDETLDDCRVDDEQERKQTIAALITCGFWHATDGGYMVHDYLEYNPSRASSDANREWDRRRKELSRDPELVEAIRARDGNRCRYCGTKVDWRDRRSRTGATYDHVTPRGPNTLENVVVACRGCNMRKGGRTPEEAAMVLMVPASLGPASGDDPGRHEKPVPVKAAVNGTQAPVKYDGKPVPPATLEVAVEILAAFNEQAGTTYKPFTAVDKPSESLRRILGSVLRLKLTAERGRAMIAHQLADPYWQGPAATGNVFGPGVDERNHQATAPGAAPVSSVEFVERLNAGQARLQRDIPAPSQDAA